MPLAAPCVLVRMPAFKSRDQGGQLPLLCGHLHSYPKTPQFVSRCGGFLCGIHSSMGWMLLPGALLRNGGWFAGIGVMEVAGSTLV